MARSERFIYSEKELQRQIAEQERNRVRRAHRRQSISHALTRAKKVELTELLLQLVDDEENVALWLEVQLNIKKSLPDEMLDIERAIVTATHVPKHLINYNFPYDYAAYGRIARGLERLVRDGHLHEAMELSEKLLRAGSHQVCMSDEGMMTEEIVDCLRPVLIAVEAAQIDELARDKWLFRMQLADESGFVWEKVCHPTGDKVS